MAEQARREQAGRLYQQHLDRWIATEGDPAVVASLVDALARLHGVKQWDEAAFGRAVVDGALRGWRPDSRAIAYAGALRLVSTSCPLGAATEADGSACDLCVSFQREVVRRTRPGHEIAYDERIAHGESACVADVRPRRRSA